MDHNKLKLIRTFHTSSAGQDALNSEIINYFWIYNVDVNDEFLKIAFEYLTNRGHLKEVQYRFLCWLNHSYDYPIKINKPYIVKPTYYKKAKFETAYLFSEKRKSRFKLLSDYIDKLKKSEKMESISILIGGSFSDETNETPKDIDIVILIPKSQGNNHLPNLETQYLLHPYLFEKVDMKFLPENYSLNKFKAYSHIISLGNKARQKDEYTGKELSNNELEKRKIIIIKL